MTVLIVDDSYTIRRLLSLPLTQMGATQVLEAESAEKALQLIRYCPTIDLIITDWHMSGMDGLTLLKTLRQMPRFQSTPIIMSTSEAAGENVVAALRAGVTNYIIKPFDKKQLAEKVGPYLKAAAGTVTAAGASQSGGLGDGELGSLLQFLIQTKKTGECELTADAGVAHIFLVEGRIAAAEFQGARGDQAFFECFKSRPKSYVFHDGHTNSDPTAAIEMNTTALLLEAAARADHSRRDS